VPCPKVVLISQLFFSISNLYRGANNHSPTHQIQTTRQLTKHKLNSGLASINYKNLLACFFSPLTADSSSPDCELFSYLARKNSLLFASPASVWKNLSASLFVRLQDDGCTDWNMVERSRKKKNYFTAIIVSTCICMSTGRRVYGLEHGCSLFSQERLHGRILHPALCGSHCHLCLILGSSSQLSH
jgi:hypothetical protein